MNINFKQIREFQKVVLDGLFIIILSAVTAMAIIYNVLIYFDNNAGDAFNKMIVTVDVGEIINEFIDSNKSKDLTSDELNQLVDIFSSKLSSHIKKKADEEKIVIVPKQAVIAGGTDYTALLKAEILKDL